MKVMSLRFTIILILEAILNRFFTLFLGFKNLPFALNFASVFRVKITESLKSNPK